MKLTVYLLWIICILGGVGIPFLLFVCIAADLSRNIGVVHLIGMLCCLIILKDFTQAVVLRPPSTHKQP
jgi:hypothetical protein